MVYVLSAQPRLTRGSALSSTAPIPATPVLQGSAVVVGYLLTGAPSFQQALCQSRSVRRNHLASIGLEVMGRWPHRGRAATLAAGAGAPDHFCHGRALCR